MLADQLAFSKKGEADKASAFAQAQADKENLKGDLDKASAALSETERQRLIALKDAAERQEVINLKDQDLNTIKDQMAERNKAISVLTNQVSKLETDIGGLKTDFNTKITNLDNTNKELARQNGELTANNKNLTANLNTSRTQVADLDKNLKDATSRLVATDQQLQAAKTTVTDLTQKNTTLAQQRDNALTDKATAETQAKNLNIKIGEEQARTVAAKSLAQEQQTRADTAEKQVVAKTAQANAVIEERDNIKKINERMTQDIGKFAESADTNTKATLKEVIAQAKAIPQSPNKLFNEFIANRVPLQMQLSRNKPGIIFVNGKLIGGDQH